MPLYPIECPECGSGEGFSRTACSPGDPIECFDCPAMAVVLNKVPIPNFTGRDYIDSGVNGWYSKQAGRFFENAKDVERWAAKKGYEVVSPKDSTWKDIKESNRNEADKDAKREGFRDADHRRRELKENAEEYRVRAAEKKIKKHHDEYGSAGRKDPKEFLAEVDAGTPSG